MIHNGSVVYTVRLDESTQNMPERQVVNLSDRQAGASEGEDHNKADVLQRLLRCYAREEQLIKSHRYNVITGKEKRIMPLNYRGRTRDDIVMKQDEESAVIYFASLTF